MACTAARSRSVSVGTMPASTCGSMCKRAYGIGELYRHCVNVGQQNGTADLLPEACG